MTQPSHSEKNPWAAALGEAFQAGWQRTVASDPHDPLLDRLAAYADGRLSADEEEAVAREIADSPAALEILSALMENADQPRRLPSLETPAAAPVVAPRAPEPIRERRRSSLAAWAAAAGLLVAGWGLVRVRSLDGEVAALTRRAHESTSALVAAEKERLAELDADAGAPYLVGAGSTELAAEAIAALGASLRGQTRDGPGMTDEQAAELAAAQARLAAAAELFDQSTLAGQLEHAAALVAGGHLDEAEAALAEIEHAAATPPTMRAQWENASATLAARRAAEARVADAAPLWERSESLYRSAAEHGLNDAWLNLALMLAEQGGKQREALEAAQHYLDAASDPAQRALLENALGQ